MLGDIENKNNCARLVLIKIRLCKKNVRSRVKIDVNSIRNTERGPAFSQISLEKKVTSILRHCITAAVIKHISATAIIYKIYFYPQIEANWMQSLLVHIFKYHAKCMQIMIRHINILNEIR